MSYKLSEKSASEVSQGKEENNHAYHRQAQQDYCADEQVFASIGWYDGCKTGLMGAVAVPASAFLPAGIKIFGILIEWGHCSMKYPIVFGSPRPP